MGGIRTSIPSHGFCVLSLPTWSFSMTGKSLICIATTKSSLTVRRGAGASNRALERARLMDHRLAAIPLTAFRARLDSACQARARRSPSRRTGPAPGAPRLRSALHEEGRPVRRPCAGAVSTVDAGVAWTNVAPFAGPVGRRAGRRHPCGSSSPTPATRWPCRCSSRPPARERVITCEEVFEPP